MMSARLASLRSKDPSCQVGSVVVDNDTKRIIGTGYNGMPAGRDDLFPWGKEGPEGDTKYPYVVHSELNCILNCPAKTRSMTMFVTKFPCGECAKAIGQFGISKVVFYDKVPEGPDHSTRILQACGIELVPYVGCKELTVRMAR